MRKTGKRKTDNGIPCNSGACLGRGNLGRLKELPRRVKKQRSPESSKVVYYYHRRDERLYAPSTLDQQRFRESTNNSSMIP
ncbi:unnamed protein product [Caenorhabditis auriculariae]|uniref:Uncharacterized protein n=1 Tax=Caenorhabditis auriculariae TaxID=2777116 RepID=A0A8S1HQH3_9PELO|nr:unnamed protein product [Caenorhabditis auriculariae]